MEQFLRTYYTNLNPNATEEEILAFLQSQGFGLGDQTVTGGIMNTLNMMQDSGSDSGGVNNIVKGTGFGKPPGALSSFLVGLAAPPVGVAMGLRNLASQGKLPFGLNEVFGNEYTGSGINKEALKQGIAAAQADSDPGDIGGGDNDAGYTSGQDAGMGFGGGRSDPTDKS